MEVVVKILDPDDAPELRRVVADVFDYDLIPNRTTEFLRDPRHHLAVAFVGDDIVGFASAVHYVHPDKEPELWVNEVGVATAFQQRGIAKRLLEALFVRAKSLGCGEAWVLTDATNEPAQRLYRSAGGHASEQVLFTFRLQ